MRDASSCVCQAGSMAGSPTTRSGDLGLPDASAAAVKATLRLFQHVHRVPRGCALRRVYRYYRRVAAANGEPPGNYCRWVRECLGMVGAPEGSFENGWPLGVSLAASIDRWQHRAWSARVARSELLCGQYARLCKHRELAEYMREGNARSRRALLRWRSDQIPTEVMRGRYARPQVPHALRHCRRCPLAECEDTVHVLLRCPIFAGERAQLVAAVRAAMPRHGRCDGRKPGSRCCSTAIWTAYRTRRFTGAR